MFPSVLKTAFACLVMLPSLNITAQAQSSPIKNVVLVHGAWADGSGWKGVYDILVKDGYSVSIVQEPETSFKEDVAASMRILALQDGKCILVGHSYGGSRNHRSWDGSGGCRAGLHRRPHASRRGKRI